MISWSMIKKQKKLAIAFIFLSLTAMTMALFACGGVQAGPEHTERAFNNPRAIAAEPNGDLLVADFGSGDIFRIDRHTGELGLLSDNTDAGMGPHFVQPGGIVVLPDGRIYVADLALNSVLEVDARSGNRSQFVENAGQAIRQPFGLDAGPVNGKIMLIVADTGSPQNGEVIGPITVDPDTGEITPLAADDEAGVLYNDPRSVVLDADRGKIFVGNFGTGSIVAVDIDSGERQIVSHSGVENPVGSGPAFVSVTDMALSRDGDSVIVVDLGLEALIAVDIETGDRRVITKSFGEKTGSGTDFLNPHGIEITEAGYMITDFGLPGIIHVSFDGKRRIFSATPLPGFSQLRGIDVLSDGTIVGADFGAERIIGVDPETGARHVISGGDRGSGPSFNGPVTLDQLDNRTLVVGEFSNQVIFFVDRETGERRYLSGPGTGGRGGGPAVGTRSLVVDATTPGRILATDFALDAVVNIDIASGDRSIYSAAGTDSPRGDGPPLNNPFGLDIGPDGTVFVTDIGVQAVFAIDALGNRKIISSNDRIGRGLKFASPWGIQLIDGQLMVADAPGIIRIDQTNGDRALVSEGGPLFTIRKLDEDTLAIANIGATNGIELGTIVIRRTILSNAEHP